MSSNTKSIHWTSNKFSKHIMMDALIKHLLSLTLYRMTDIGEVFEVMSQLKDGDEERWISVWGSMAQRLQKRAEEAEVTERRASAFALYLRASTYWRASLLFFSFPEDSRMRDYAIASSQCYEKYLELSGYPGKYIEIPYEDTFLPGHFYKSPNATGNAPLLILTPGRDTWAEDTAWVFDACLRRGIHCLTYDGPGQGFALRLNNLRFRHDWENVIKPVVDFALTLPGIDSSRVGAMGLSFGAFLSTRAVAFEKRIKVCITDPGNLSWGSSIIGHFPKPIGRIASGQGSDALRKLFTWTAMHTPMLSWLIRDYAWKHGVPNEDVFKALLAYDNASVIDRIECTMLVMDGTEEMAKGQAKKLFDVLKCPKEYMLFDATSTAQSHCQLGAYATASDAVLDWLEKHL